MRSGARNRGSKISLIDVFKKKKCKKIISVKRKASILLYTYNEYKFK